MKFIFYAAFCCFFVLCSCSSVKKQAEKPPEKISLVKQISECGYNTKVYFDIASKDLNYKSEDILKRVAKLQALSKTQIYLQGHADATGNHSFNLALSEKRVEQVKLYLQALGIKEDNIHISYFGDSKPAVLEYNSEAHAKNRRVEISLIPADGQNFAQANGIADSGLANPPVRKDSFPVPDRPVQELNNDPLPAQIINITPDTGITPYPPNPYETPENNNTNDEPREI